MSRYSHLLCPKKLVQEIQTWIELFRMHLFYLRGKGRRGDSGYVEGLGAKNSREVLRASVPNSTIYKDAKSIVISHSM